MYTLVKTALVEFCNLFNISARTAALGDKGKATVPALIEGRLFDVIGASRIDNEIISSAFASFEEPTTRLKSQVEHLKITNKELEVSSVLLVKRQA
jgi:hypothetical protein